MPGTALSGIDIAIGAADWAALGFSVGADRCVVGATTLTLGADGEPGSLPAWTLSAERPGADLVDGIATRWKSPGEDVPAPVPHANGARSVDHVVVTTPDIDRTFTALQQAGMTLRRERNAGSTRNPLRQGFFRHGEAIVEVVGPAQAAGDGPASLWGLVVIVDDLDAAAASFGDALGRARDAVQPGRRIATVKAPQLGALQLALMTPPA